MTANGGTEAETRAGNGASNLPAGFSDELNARLRRLKALCAAARAITPSIPSQPGRPPFDGTDLASALGALAKWASERAASREKLHEALAPIDGQLLAAGRDLRDLVAEIPLVQLRASLPAIERKRRVEVLALLDLLTSDPSGFQQHSVLLDYLITLLSTEERDGKRIITHDPASLTPRLRLICQQAESMHGAEAAAFAQEFYAAAAPYDGGNLEQLIRQMRRRKQSLGQLAWVPEVLRAIVTYNAAIANRIEHDLSAAHHFPEDDLLPWNTPVDEYDEPSAFEDSAAWVGSAEVDADNAGSVFESTGILAIASALKRRVAGEELGGTAAERVASRLDVSGLEKIEHQSILDMRVKPHERVLWLTITVGLVIQGMLESTLDLRELGVDPDRIQEDWAQELEHGMKRAATDRIVNEDYEEACALSELKTKYLYESVAALSRRRTNRAPRAAGAEPGLDAREVRAITEQAIARLMLKAEPVPTGLVGFYHTWRSEVLAVVAVVLCGMAIMNVVGTSKSEIVLATPAQLIGMSEHLVSGYRDGYGTGRLFVGTVGPSWHTLDAKQQYEAAQQMVRATHAIGAREFMAVDEVRKVHVQGVDGIVRLPAAPKDSGTPG